jgi:hypothetical protein
LHSALITLGEQLPYKRLVVASALEVPAATQEQRLVQGTLELVMALLHVTVFVGPGRVDGLTLQAIVP